ncbi:MAG: DUF3866 family protein [Actinobacteria bacterium]|nr:MAG: DUF3866 family protein [Actinomycetota bacterium]
MLSIKQAVVKKIIEVKQLVSKVEVEIEGKVFPAYNYEPLTGDIEVGSRVLVNTTAVDLGLGTGGAHFVFYNQKNRDFSNFSPGHIMKLRYTPYQFSVLSEEAQESVNHDILKDKKTIEGMPVIVGTLHSQLPAIAVTAKVLKPEVRIAYIMTDAAALPIAFSRQVFNLAQKGFIDNTITLGNAFGGDYEAVNIFSALAIARWVVEADIAIVTMGPGIVGTGTALGFSGIEQGVNLNAVASLKGFAVAVPRISFRDKRSRHYGLSHHTLTSLSIAALTQVSMALPKMDSQKLTLVMSQVKKHGLDDKHLIEIIENDITLDALKRNKIKVTTMQRLIEQEKEYFQASGCAAMVALRGV